jgi:hypothetical protein
VTDLGIQTVDPAPHYWIEAEKLTETTTDGQKAYYDWPIHMADTAWVNIESFIEVFSQALRIHEGRYTPDVDLAKLERSFAEARKTTTV